MRKNTQARALIKQLAMQAKERMKKDNYGSYEEKIQLKRQIDRRNNLMLIKNENFSKNDITIKIINDSVDEENFKKRVYALLESNQDITNPLSKLVNKEEFKHFNSVEQEKYILELSDKYLKVKENYYKHYSC